MAITFFPLLHKDTMVGRIDVKADRQASCLKVAGLWWEKNVRVSPSRVRALQSELDRLRRFADLDSVHFNKPSSRALQIS